MGLEIINQLFSGDHQLKRHSKTSLFRAAKAYRWIWDYAKLTMEDLS